MLEATVAALQTPPAQLRAWLGPAAGPADYEIGEEVFHAFVGHDPAAEAAFVATRPGHWKVDLFALARQRLQAAAGVTRIDAQGKWVTPGLIDVHSHLGVYPRPGVGAHSDGNEMTAPVPATVWAAPSPM
ncbi:hypothetical protein G6F61_013939 [Rhizopus arrhizus]|nr:hypothetical protein G6F61_013939 [Rhizopus arrhizus]